MIRTFWNTGTADIFDGVNSPGARVTLPPALWKTAVRLLDHLDAAVAINDLRLPPRNRLEALRGERDGQYSLRINEHYRVCFTATNRGLEQVEITAWES